MNNQQQKERLSIAIGIGLIILVGIITYARGIKPQQTDTATSLTTPSENSTGDSIGTIAFDTLESKIQNKEPLQLLDIRTEPEYTDSHILDSVNISLDALENDPSLRISNSVPVVLIGKNASDENVTTAAAILKKKNITNVLAVSGGMTGWLNSGGNTITPGDPTRIADQAKIQLIPKETLQKEFNASDIQIIDARPADAFAQGHIPNAKNIPFEEIERRRNEIDSKKIIVVYDSDEIQGFQSGVRISDMFMITPFVLKGGFTQWSEAKFEIVK